MTVAAGVAEHAFALFLGLQRQARQAASSEQLAYAMVNDGQALFGFRHAALLIAGKVQALTGISVVEPHAPFVAFVERAAHTLQGAGVAGQAGSVDPTRLDAQALADWQSLSAAHAYWLPLLDRQGEMFGGLWLARDQAFNPAEQALLNQLADTYAHAWLALRPARPWRLRWPRRRLLAMAGALLLVLLVPVRQSVLAPAEVVPRAGRVVAAPLDGVIAEFLVKPNQTVAMGDVLVRFDATTLRAQADVAARALGWPRPSSRPVPSVHSVMQSPTPGSICWPLVWSRSALSSITPASFWGVARSAPNVPGSPCSPMPSVGWAGRCRPASA